MFKKQLPKIPVKLDLPKKVYHGTSGPVYFKYPKPPAHFSSDIKLSWEYAKYEHSGEKARVLEYKIVDVPKLIYIPAMMRVDYNFVNKYKFMDGDTGTYDDAIYWLEKIFNTNFDGIGYKRMPEAFKAICDGGFDGFFFSYSGSDDLMFCEPEKFLKYIKTIVK